MTTIQVLGTDCPRCAAMYENARRAAEAAHLECRIEKVADIEKIMAYDVLMTPALVIDGEVRSVGRVPSAEEIRAMLGQARAGRRAKGVQYEGEKGCGHCPGGLCGGEPRLFRPLRDRGARGR